MFEALPRLGRQDALCFVEVLVNRFLEREATEGQLEVGVRPGRLNLGRLGRAIGSRHHLVSQGADQLDALSSGSVECGKNHLCDLLVARQSMFCSIDLGRLRIVDKPVDELGRFVHVLRLGVDRNPCRAQMIAGG